MGNINTLAPLAGAAAGTYFNIKKYHQQQHEQDQMDAYRQAMLKQNAAEDATRRYVADQSNARTKQEGLQKLGETLLSGIYGANQFDTPELRQGALDAFGRIAGDAYGTNPFSFPGTHPAAPSAPARLNDPYNLLTPEVQQDYATDQALISRSPSEAALIKAMAGNPLAQVPRGLSLKADETAAGLAKTNAETKNLGIKGETDQTNLDILRATKPELIRQPGLANAQTEQATKTSGTQADLNTAEAAAARGKEGRDVQLFPQKLAQERYGTDILAQDLNTKTVTNTGLTDRLAAELRKTNAGAAVDEATAQFLGKTAGARKAEIESRTARNRAEASATTVRAEAARRQTEINSGFLGVARLRYDLEKKRNPATIAKMEAETRKLIEDSFISPEDRETIISLQKQLISPDGFGGGTINPQVQAQLDEALRRVTFTAQAQRLGLGPQQAKGVYGAISSGKTMQDAIKAYQDAYLGGNIDKATFQKATNAIKYLYGNVWPGISKANTNGVGSNGGFTVPAPPAP